MIQRQPRGSNRICRDARGRADERVDCISTIGQARQDRRVLTREEFDAQKLNICASGPPSSDDNLLGMEIDSDYYLGDPGDAVDADFDLWRDMEVAQRPGQEWLITGVAQARPNDAAAIADSLSRIWDSYLRYGYREAHTVERHADEVVLLAVTQIDPGAFWVTVKVTVRLNDH
jgi:hypothetical protein